MSRLIFKGSIDETEVARLHEGMKMKVSIGALTGHDFAATLEYISPKVSTTAGQANQFEIKGALALPSGVNIRAGYSANAEIVLEERSNVLSVPEGAIEFVGDSAFVHVLTSPMPQTFTRRAVKTGLSDGMHIEILSGLKGGEQVRGNLITQQP
jgi:HlyD family secretion protein